MPEQTDREKDFLDAYNQAWSVWGPWQSKAKEDIGAFLGVCLTDAEKNKLKLQGRDVLEFQFIRRVINWVSGYQSDHRSSVIYEPTEDSDETTANQLTRLGFWAMARSHGYEKISTAFQHSLKAGMCLVNCYNDQQLNSNLDLFYYNRFLLDPYFTQIDLSDCHYGILCKHITEEDALMLFPQEKHALIRDIMAENGPVANKFPNYTVPTLYGKRKHSLYEFQQRSTKEYYSVSLNTTGEEVDWAGTKAQLDDMITMVVQAGYPQDMISVQRKIKPTVNVTHILNGKEINFAKDPFGYGDFSFTPVVGYWDPEYDDMWLKCQGIVRGLKDHQRAETKKVLSMIAMFEQHIGSGLDYEQGALVDDEDAFKTGSGTPRVFTSGSIAGNRARDRVVPDIPSGMITLYEILDRMGPKIAGFNEEMFGIPSNDNLKIAGILAKMRMGAGLIGLRCLFDNLSLSQGVIGAKFGRLLQRYPPSRVKRILSEEPAPAFYEGQFGHFDSVVGEGMLTDTQRGLMYSELVNLKQMGLEMGDPAPITWSMLMKYAPIQMKTELMADMQKMEQERQAQQQQQEKMVQAMQMLAMKQTVAQIAENEAQAAERQSQNIENQANSALTRVKTAVEINELKDKGTTELLKAAIDLEKLRIEEKKNARPVPSKSR